MHHAGATALAELRKFSPPAPEQRLLPCPCGHQAHYRELRSMPILTVLGRVEARRPYYLCPRFADREVDIEKIESYPGVRRMQAAASHHAPFDRGREQMTILAGLKLTTKAVERTAGAIGADIAHRGQQEIQRDIQLDLPIVIGEPASLLYVQMDGTSVPVVKKETDGRKGKADGQPAHTRESILGCVFTQTTWNEERFAIRDLRGRETEL